MAIIISADEIKKTLSGYNPRQAESFHEKSARLADREFKRSLKTCSESKVIIMAGGAASGKTEYVSTYLKRQEVVVFDGTLPTFEGARIKIQGALKVVKAVEIHLVIPALLQSAFFTFLNRERKFPASNFYRTHAGARQSVLIITRKYPDIPVRIFISDIDSLDSKTMSFKELEFVSRQKLIEYLKKNQYTEENIMNEVAQR